MPLTKGQMEDEITKALIHWELEYLGRGPSGAKTDIVRDMVIVSLVGILSPAEYHLAHNSEGMALIKKLRQQLVEQGRPELESIVQNVTQAKVISLHTDISTKTGERLFVFKLDREP